MILDGLSALLCGFLQTPIDAIAPTGAWPFDFTALSGLWAHAVGLDADLPIHEIVGCAGAMFALWGVRLGIGVAQWIGGWVRGRGSS